MSVYEIMNSVRRSGCVLFKLCRGAVSTVRPVHQRVRSLSGLSALTHLDRTEIRPTHLNGTELRLRGFQRLHSDTHTSPGEHTDEETRSTAQTASPEEQQQGPLDFNLDMLVSLLRQENAEDICVIKVPVELKYTDYFIIVSGSSTRHLRAMALYAIKVYKFMKRDFDPHVHIEGKDAEDWMCIDFGSMVVHFMLPETRETYELEKLWTLRHFDEQFRSIPTQSLPEDFIFDAETK